MAKLKIGIDFGTCNIKVAKWAEGKKCAEMISLSKSQHDADKAIPNVIAYTKSSCLVGGPALQTESYIAEIKRKLEQEQWKTFIKQKDRECSAIEIAQDIFAWIKERYPHGRWPRADAPELQALSANL